MTTILRIAAIVCSLFITALTVGGWFTIGVPTTLGDITACVFAHLFTIMMWLITTNLFRDPGAW